MFIDVYAQTNHFIDRCQNEWDRNIWICHGMCPGPCHKFIQFCCHKQSGNTVVRTYAPWVINRDNYYSAVLHCVTCIFAYMVCVQHKRRTQRQFGSL